MEKVMNKHISQDSRELREDELNAATGGNTISHAIDGIGKALQEVARKESGGASGSGESITTIFGYVIPLPS
jgi:hypothetical protein